jgi:hypothetical protein
LSEVRKELEMKANENEYLKNELKVSNQRLDTTRELAVLFLFINFFFIIFFLFCSVIFSIVYCDCFYSCYYHFLQIF